MQTSIERRLRKLEAEQGRTKSELELLSFSVKEIRDAKLIYEIRSHKRTMEDPLNNMCKGSVFISGVVLGFFLAVLFI